MSDTPYRLFMAKVAWFVQVIEASKHKSVASIMRGEVLRIEPSKIREIHERTLSQLDAIGGPCIRCSNVASQHLSFDGVVMQECKFFTSREDPESIWFASQKPLADDAKAMYDARDK